MVWTSKIVHIDHQMEAISKLATAPWMVKLPYKLVNGIMLISVTANEQEGFLPSIQGQCGQR